MVATTALRRICFEPEVVQVGFVRGLETTALGTGAVVSWVLVAVLEFGGLAWNSSWIGDSSVATRALRVPATLKSQSRVLLARFDTAADDVDGATGSRDPRSWSKVVHGPVDAGGDAGSLTTGLAGGAASSGLWLRKGSETGVRGEL